MREKIGSSYPPPRQATEGLRPGWKDIQARRASRLELKKREKIKSVGAL